MIYEVTIPALRMQLEQLAGSVYSCSNGHEPHTANHIACLSYINGSSAAKSA